MVEYIATEEELALHARLHELYLQYRKNPDENTARKLFEGCSQIGATAVKNFKRHHGHQDSIHSDDFDAAIGDTLMNVLKTEAEADHFVRYYRTSLKRRLIGINRHIEATDPPHISLPDDNMVRARAPAVATSMIAEENVALLCNRVVNTVSQMQDGFVEVFTHMLKGDTIESTANALNIATGTVKSRLAKVYSKLNDVGIGLEDIDRSSHTKRLLCDKIIERLDQERGMGTGI